MKFDLIIKSLGHGIYQVDNTKDKLLVDITNQLKEHGFDIYHILININNSDQAFVLTKTGRPPSIQELNQASEELLCDLDTTAKQNECEPMQRRIDRLKHSISTRSI